MQSTKLNLFLLTPAEVKRGAARVAMVAAGDIVDNLIYGSEDIATYSERSPKGKYCFPLFHWYIPLRVVKLIDCIP